MISRARTSFPERRRPRGPLGLSNAAIVYLLAVVAVGMGYGSRLAVGTSVASFLLYDFFFVQPLYTFSVATPDGWLDLILFLVDASWSMAVAERMAATKGAILAMTRALAWELAAWNIRVNSISPGSVDTPMLRGDIKLESDRTGIPFEEVKKEREAEQAFKRWADPSEIAAPIYFLASEEASFITGTDLLVDCGLVAK